MTGTVVHCSIDCCFDTCQLDYLLHLDKPVMRELGSIVCERVIRKMGEHATEPEHHVSEQAYLTFKLCLKRRAALSDFELDRLEALFAPLLADFMKWTDSLSMYPACEGMWSIVQPGSLPIGMCWETSCMPRDQYFFMLDLKFG